MAGESDGNFPEPGALCIPFIHSAMKEARVSTSSLSPHFGVGTHLQSNGVSTRTFLCVRDIASDRQDSSAVGFLGTRSNLVERTLPLLTNQTVELSNPTDRQVL